MIAVGREIEVRKLLGKGVTVAEINRITGVSRLTIRTIKKHSKIRERAPLPAGFKRIRNPKRCRECGSKVSIWPCVQCNLAGQYHRNNIRQDDNAELLEIEHLMPEIKKIIIDLGRFDREGSSADPFIRDIAKRASKIYTRLPGGEK